MVRKFLDSFKMKPVAVVTVNTTHESPLGQMITGRKCEWEAIDSVTFLENGRGKRRIKATATELESVPSVLRWINGGDLPRAAVRV